MQPAVVQTCYRHPDQPAGVICQRCDRPICPRCMHQASVGFHCPECARTGRQRVVQGSAAFAGGRASLDRGPGLGVVLDEAWAAQAMRAGDLAA